jgi:intracellular sulfur oxidation DsrE/DsrF family protein
VKIQAHNLLAMLLVAAFFVPGIASAAKPVNPVNFVVQLTKSNDNHGQKIALQQIEKVIQEMGGKKVHFTVVAYEEGISALLSNNLSTSQLLMKLSDEGVGFKAGQASMEVSRFKKDDFPIEVTFVPSGAAEVIRLQMQGYKYWQP